MAKKILIVEDNLSLVAFYQEALRGLVGCTVLTEANGIAALAVARQELPDVMLLDVELPGMDGFAVLRALREDDLLNQIQVILQTGTALSVREKARAFAWSAYDYLAKPIHPVELRARIEAALTRREMEDCYIEEREWASRTPGIDQAIAALHQAIRSALAAVYAGLALADPAAGTPAQQAEGRRRILQAAQELEQIGRRAGRPAELDPPESP